MCNFRRGHLEATGIYMGIWEDMALIMSKHVLVALVRFPTSSPVSPNPKILKAFTSFLDEQFSQGIVSTHRTSQTAWCDDECKADWPSKS